MALRHAYRPGLVLLIALLAAGGQQVLADDKDEGAEVDEIDYVSLAARLLRDENYDRAAAALRQVDRKQPGLDLRRFHTLEGLIALRQQRFKEAAQAFGAAIKAKPPVDVASDDDDDDDKAKRAAPPPVEPELFLYLAQAHFGAKEYKPALAAIKRGGGALAKEPSVYFMRAQAHWELKEPDAAFTALAQGDRRFPDEPDYARMRVFYLIELGLYQEAMGEGLKYLERKEAAAADYVAVAEALRQGQQPKRAGLILERAHLRFPFDESVMLALAHTYIDRERPLSAAIILEDAARLNPKYAVEAAELYKEAGRLERALSLNARITDQVAKYRQRLSILLAMEHFERVSAMASTLERVGLLKDEQVRYALAYGFYKSGDFEAAERHLKQLREASLFESANQLRKAMERCRESGWECT